MPDKQQHSHGRKLIILTRPVSFFGRQYIIKVILFLRKNGRIQSLNKIDVPLTEQNGQTRQHSALFQVKSNKYIYK